MLIGFHVNSIDDINWNTSTFRADLYWWIRYPQPLDRKVKEATIEALEFTNGEAIEGQQNRLQKRKFCRAVIRSTLPIAPLLDFISIPTFENTLLTNSGFRS